MEPIQNGDAVASYALFARASEVFAARPDLPSLIALFSLIEAAVLYESVWYVPFGDTSVLQVKDTPVWGELAQAQVCRIAEFDKDQVLMSPARAEFEHSMRALGPVPTYNDVNEKESLQRAFNYGIGVAAPVIFSWTRSFLDEELQTAEGVRKFVGNVDGTGGSTGEDRQLDWERAASYVARACVAGGRGADYVGDPFEHPIAALSLRLRRVSPTARLYSQLVQAFDGKLEGLRDDGYPMALTIPPISALIMDRCDGTLQSVIREMINLRDEFANFRAKYRGYALVLRDPGAQTLKELLDERWTAIQEVNAAIHALGEQRTDSTLIQGLIGGNIKVGDGGGFESVSVDPAVSLGGLAKVAIQKVKTAVVKARASILFDVWSKALDIAEYNTLSKRRFGTSFSDLSVLGYKQYAQAVEKLISPIRS